MMPERATDEIEIGVTIRNTSNQPLTLYLEPWGEEYPMATQQEFVVLGQGPKAGSGFWIEHGDRTITVFGWTNSVVRVFEKERELGGSANKPRIPPFDDSSH